MLLAAVAAVLWGLSQAWSQAWTCDDAYISFRYAENLSQGLGLVYNAGERVEGYTNFLWTVLVAAGMGMGLDPLQLGHWLGLGFYAGSIALLWRAAGKFWPLAAVGWALHWHAQSFATCGLETAMFTFLVTAMLVTLLRAAHARQYLLCGLLGVLATMTRPDGAIFCFAAGGMVLWQAWRQGRWQLLLYFVLPTLVLYLPYFCIKWSYYGYPFPNTFYAKSASRAYAEQGWFYVFLYFRCYYVLLLGLGLALAFCMQAKSRRAVAVLLFTLPYLAYVIYVGGDFMFSRFLLPVTPALFLGLQLLLPKLRLPWQAGTYAFLVCLAVLAYWYPQELSQPQGLRGVVEERLFYPPERTMVRRSMASALHSHTRGTDTRVMIGAGQADLAFFGKFPVVIERNGLTDEFIAHYPMPERGRVGHERASLVPEHYFFRRGVNFAFSLEPGPHAVSSDVLGEQRRVWFKWVGIEDHPLYEKIKGTDKEWIKASLVTYRKELMAELQARGGVRFSNFEAYLDAYIAGLGEKSKQQVAADLTVFTDYYFKHNEDAQRWQTLKDHLR